MSYADYKKWKSGDYRKEEDDEDGEISKARKESDKLRYESQGSFSNYQAWKEGKYNPSEVAARELEEKKKEEEYKAQEKVAEEEDVSFLDRIRGAASSIQKFFERTPETQRVQIGNDPIRSDIAGIGRERSQVDQFTDKVGQIRDSENPLKLLPEDLGLSTTKRKKKPSVTDAMVKPGGQYDTNIKNILPGGEPFVDKTDVIDPVNRRLRELDAGALLEDNEIDMQDPRIQGILRKKPESVHEGNNEYVINALTTEKLKQRDREFAAALQGWLEADGDGGGLVNFINRLPINIATQANTASEALGIGSFDNDPSQWDRVQVEKLLEETYARISIYDQYLGYAETDKSAMAKFLADLKGSDIADYMPILGGYQSAVDVMAYDIAMRKKVEGLQLTPYEENLVARTDEGKVDALIDRGYAYGVASSLTPSAQLISQYTLASFLPGFGKLKDVFKPTNALSGWQQAVTTIGNDLVKTGALTVTTNANQILEGIVQDTTPVYEYALDEENEIIYTEYAPDKAFNEAVLDNVVKGYWSTYAEIALGEYAVKGAGKALGSFSASTVTGLQVVDDVGKVIAKGGDDAIRIADGVGVVDDTVVVSKAANEAVKPVLAKRLIGKLNKRLGFDSTRALFKEGGRTQWQGNIPELVEEFLQAGIEGQFDSDDTQGFIDTIINMPSDEALTIVGSTMVMSLPMTSADFAQTRARIAKESENEEVAKKRLELLEIIEEQIGSTNPTPITDLSDFEPTPDVEPAPIGDESIPVEPTEGVIPDVPEKEMTPKEKIQADLAKRGDVEPEPEETLTQIVQKQDRASAYEAIGSETIADKIIDGEITSARALLAEAEKEGVTDILGESLGVYDLLEHPDEYIEVVGMSPADLTEEAAFDEAFKVLASGLMSDVATGAKEAKANKAEQLQGDISLGDLSEDELSELSGITQSIQTTFENPPRRTSTQVESGEWVISKDGAAYPSFVSEGLRSKAVLSKALDAFNNDTVPKRGTKAYDAYQEILNHVVGTEGAISEKESEPKKEKKAEKKKKTPKKAQPKAKKKAKPSGAVEQTKKEKGTSYPTTARESAKDLIRSYVERGDSLESLKKGRGGSSRPDGYSASIGGWANEKRVPPSKIVVSRMDGKDIEPEIFDLKELYDEIKQGAKEQPAKEKRKDGKKPEAPLTFRRTQPEGDPLPKTSVSDFKVGDTVDIYMETTGKDTVIERGIIVTISKDQSIPSIEIVRENGTPKWYSKTFSAKLIADGSSRLEDVPVSPYRKGYPTPRGDGWTEKKIDRELKTRSSDFSEKSWKIESAKFKNDKELEAHMFYHGTQSPISRGLRPSSTFPKSWDDNQLGGGYGERYHSISLSKQRNVAKNFSGMSSTVSIYPVLLKKDAVVKNMENAWDDSAWIEEELEQLWNDGYDAVWIGGGEQELAVLNPRAIVLGKHLVETHAVYQMPRLENRGVNELRDEGEVSAAKERISYLSHRVDEIFKKESDITKYSPGEMGTGIRLAMELDTLKRKYGMIPKNGSNYSQCVLEMMNQVEEQPYLTPRRAMWAKDINEAIKKYQSGVRNRVSTGILQGFEHIDSIHNIVKLNELKPAGIYKKGSQTLKLAKKQGLKLFTESQIVLEINKAKSEAGEKLMDTITSADEKPNNSLFSKVLSNDLDIKTVEEASIKGSMITSHKDIVKNLKKYRGAAVEIAQIVFTNSDGEVVEHMAWTDLSPVSTWLPAQEKDIKWLMNYVPDNASGFYLVHNHPSGTMRPSSADLRATKAMVERFKEYNLEYKDHIILDTKEYLNLGKYDEKGADDFDWGADYGFSEWAVHPSLVDDAGPILTEKRQIKTSSDLGGLAKQFLDEKRLTSGITLVPLDSQFTWREQDDVIPIGVPNFKEATTDKNREFRVSMFLNDKIKDIKLQKYIARSVLIINEENLSNAERDLLAEGSIPLDTTDVALINKNGGVQVLAINAYNTFSGVGVDTDVGVAIRTEEAHNYDTTGDLAKNGRRLLEPQSEYSKADKREVVGETFLTNSGAMEQFEEKVQPIALPEMLEMARTLSENDVDLTVFRKENQRGVFKYNATTGRIKLSRGLFSQHGDKTPEELAQVPVSIDERTGETELMPETKEERKERMEQMMKILAHEIGHLADWLPHKSMTRGNIVGRIASLNRHMKDKFGNLSNKEIKEELVNVSEVWRGGMKDIEHAYLKAKEALNKADPVRDSEQVARIKSILKEVEKERKYRFSSKELYADALSMLLNDPDQLEQIAPKFYNGFMDYINRKPKVSETLLATYDLINEGQDAISRARYKTMINDFAEGKETRTQVGKKVISAPGKAFKKVFDGAIETIASQYNPVYSAIDESIADRDIKLSEKAKTKMKLEDLALINNDLGLYVNEVEKIFAKMVEAGIDEDQAGVLALLERTLGDRKDVANPNAMMYQYSQETLDGLKEQLTDRQYRVLQTQMQKFRELNFEIVQKGHEAGLFSKQFMKEIAEMNKDTYMPFAVLDYIESNYVTSKVINVVGTLKGVENPIITQVLKSISIIQATAVNNAKRQIVSSISEVDPENVRPAVVRRGKGGRFVSFERLKGEEAKTHDILPLMVDGKMAGFVMDKDIATLFEDPWRTNKGQAAIKTAKILGVFNFWFKPLVTTYNLSWALYSNPIRDFQRSSKGLFAVLAAENKLSAVDKATVGLSLDIRLIKEMATGLLEAGKFAMGKETETTKEMLEKRMLAIQVDPVSGSDAGKFDGYEVLAPALRKVGKLKPDIEYEDSTVNRKIQALKKNPLVKLGWYIPDKFFRLAAFTGRTFEVWSKISAYKILKSKGVKDEALVNTVRNYVGTPNFMERGLMTPVTNEVFVFSNVAIQARREQLELMKTPGTRGAYWLKLLSTAIIPKFIMALIEFGYLGDDDDELAMKMATFYDKTKKNIIPLGMVTDPDTGSKRALYMPLPTDEDSRTFGIIAYQIFKILLEEDDYKFADLGKTGKYIIDDVNPLSSSIGIDVLSIWGSYLSGENPNDSWRNRPAIYKPLWDEGGKTRFFEMVKLTGNTMGFPSLKTYDERSDTTLDILLQMPVLERMFELTSYGLTEQKYREQDLADTEKAAEKNSRDNLRKDLVETYFSDSSITMEEAIEEYQVQVMGEEPDDGWHGDELADHTRRRKEFKADILAHHYPDEAQWIDSVGRNADKVNDYEQVKNMRTKEQWEKFAVMAREMEVMSDNMLELLVDEGVVDERLASKLEDL